MGFLLGALRTSTGNKPWYKIDGRIKLMDARVYGWADKRMEFSVMGINVRMDG